MNLFRDISAFGEIIHISGCAWCLAHGKCFQRVVAAVTSVLSVCSVILGDLPPSFKVLSQEGGWQNGEKIALGRPSSWVLGLLPLLIYVIWGRHFAD